MIFCHFLIFSKYIRSFLQIYDQYHPELPLYMLYFTLIFSIGGFY